MEVPGGWRASTGDDISPCSAVSVYRCGEGRVQEFVVKRTEVGELLNPICHVAGVERRQGEGGFLKTICLVDCIATWQITCTGQRRYGAFQLVPS